MRRRESLPLFQGVKVAQYKYSNYLNQSDHAEYDKLYTPGAK